MRQNQDKLLGDGSERDSDHIVSERRRGKRRLETLRQRNRIRTIL